MFVRFKALDGEVVLNVNAIEQVRPLCGCEDKTVVLTTSGRQIIVASPVCAVIAAVKIALKER